MKAEPTDIDREAAALFVPAPGMRVWFLLNGAVMARWECVCFDFAVETSGLLGLDALDTDDPATVGCMLAQVEDAVCTDDVSVEKLKPYCRGFAVFIHGSYKHKPQRTRGAALVAAMKAIKGPREKVPPSGCRTPEGGVRSHRPSTCGSMPGWLGPGTHVKGSMPAPAPSCNPGFTVEGECTGAVMWVLRGSGK